MGTLELVNRIQPTGADDSTTDGQRIVTNRRCSEYSYLPVDQVPVEGRNWLQLLTTFQGQQELCTGIEIRVLSGCLVLMSYGKPPENSGSVARQIEFWQATLSRLSGGNSRAEPVRRSRKC